jgi:DNA-binding NarL/FixJ family response regulator
MNRHIAEVLIITVSIVLQQGLGALLESLGPLKVTALKDLTSAYTWIGSHQPKMVLVDVFLAGGDPRIVMEKIRTLSPETQRVLLVDTVEDLRWLPQYAEAILIKGISPSAVAALVTNLLFSRGDRHEHNDSNA